MLLSDLTLGAGAVAETTHLGFAFSSGTPESPRPDDVDTSYLFDFLDELEAV